jgi:predicted methyltransferase
MNKLISLLSLSFLFSFSSFSSAHDLMAAIQSEDRSTKNIARDKYRNPAKTLTFFQIKPDMRVVELSPGGGWYTEILANYIHNPGVVIAAHFNADSKREYFRKSRERFEKKVIEKSMYDNVYIVNLSSELAKEGSVDAVLTFRNLHNWLGPQMDLIFSNSFKALKSGGLFGIVEHRANPGTSISDMKKSGYVTEEHAIKIAKKHGFILVAKSEINANPKDTKDHPKGVWTLPPSLRLKDIDKDKYLSIGESDRMTLLFKKP